MSVWPLSTEGWVIDKEKKFTLTHDSRVQKSKSLKLMGLCAAPCNGKITDWFGTLGRVKIREAVYCFNKSVFWQPIWCQESDNQLHGKGLTPNHLTTKMTFRFQDEFYMGCSILKSQWLQWVFLSIKTTSVSISVLYDVFAIKIIDIPIMGRRGLLYGCHCHYDIIHLGSHSLYSFILPTIGEQIWI